MLLRSADILLAPYTQDCEAVDGTRIIEYISPTKVFEYMAVGKPIISTNVGTVPEVLKDGVNGLLAEPNVDSLVVNLERVLNDPSFARKLAENARAESTRRTWEARTQTVLDQAASFWGLRFSG